MTVSKRILLGAISWAGCVTALHSYLNVDWTAMLNSRLPEDKRKLNVAYIPVT